MNNQFKKGRRIDCEQKVNKKDGVEDHQNDISQWEGEEIKLFLLFLQETII